MNMRDNDNDELSDGSDDSNNSDERLFRSNRNEWGLTSNNFSEGNASSEEKKDTPKSDTPKSDTPKSDTPASDTPKSDEKPKNESAFSEGGGDLLDLKRFSDVRETTISDHYTEGNTQNHEKFLNLLDNISEEELVLNIMWMVVPKKKK